MLAAWIRLYSFLGRIEMLEHPIVTLALKSGRLIRAVQSSGSDHVLLEQPREANQHHSGIEPMVGFVGPGIGNVLIAITEIDGGP